MEAISRAALTFLLNALWQIPAITAVAVLACRAMRNGPASHRHAVWVAALLAALLLPVISVESERPTERLQIRVAYAPDALAPPSAAASEAGASLSPQIGQTRRTVPLARTTAAAALAAYALFILLSLARLLSSWVRTVRTRRSAERRVPPPAVQQAWARCAGAFGISGVELLVSSSLDSPVTVGARRKAIILPESLFAAASPDVLVTALGHEMAHVARADFALKMFYELLYLPLSFHPACWLIRRGIERSREMACDELVTRKLLDPVIYAESMMSIAATAAGLRYPGYTLGVFDGDILEERIRRLLHRRAHNLKRARILLAGGLSALVVCGVVVSGLALSARAQSGVAAEMKLAAAAYNDGDFDAAVDHFRNAVKLDPTNTGAKLFLANALMRQSFAAHNPPGNETMADARRQYLEVLSHDGQNKTALQGMMAADMNDRQFDGARQWALKLIDLDPADKNAYYTLGVVDWAASYPEFQRAKQAAGVAKQDFFIPDAAVRARLREQLSPRLEEGVRMLEKALELDPSYSDAMAYLNLLDRLKSGIAESENESAALIANADDWVRKALAAKSREPKPPSPSPAKLDVDAPPPGPPSAHTIVAAPPPPPPPPPPPALSDTQPPSPEPPPVPRNPAERPGPFWQVTGSTAEPAGAVVKRLQARGFAASYFTNRNMNKVWVIVGPYPDAKAIDRAKVSLEKAGFHPLTPW